MRVRPEGATGGATEVTVNHTVRRRELLSSPPSERWAGARLSRLKLALGMGLAIIGLAFGGLAFGGLAFGAAQAVASPAAPFADDEATTLEAITTLNKKALKEYDNLSFDDARKTLEEALDLCSKNDLDNHPIKARTHVHLGVVLLAMGSTRRNDAIEEFRKAVAIQPDIQPSKRLASPEVQSAFNEAKVASSGGSGRSVATVAPAATAKPANSPLPAPPPAAPAQKISGAPSG
ncbi:MAG: tetratricopeptide repeat protein, partial [Myxococcales bacterium]